MKVRCWAIEHQLKLGRYFRARDFVPVAQAHIMADTESLGEVGIEWLDEGQTLGRVEGRDRLCRRIH
jgi:hypothetical protein